MRRWIRRLIPHMFHRRLALLLVAACVATAVLVAQTVLLTTVRSPQLRHDVEVELVHKRLLETARGDIRDRHGRLLAHDRISYNLAIDYDLLTGNWAFARAQRDVHKRYPGWQEMDDRDKQQLIERYQQPYDAQTQRLWQSLARLTGCDPVELEKRRNAIIRRVHRTARSYLGNLIRRRSRLANRPVTIHDVAGEQIAEQRQAHVLFEDIYDATRFELNRQSNEAQQQDPPGIWAKVTVQMATKRQYPWREAAVVLNRSTLPSPLRHDDKIEVRVIDFARHIIGNMRRRDSAGVWDAYPYRQKSDSGAATYNLHGYLNNDPIGTQGAERSHELYLRGTRGKITRYRDERQADWIEPVPGGDVKLTIDIRLTARVAAIMSGNDPTDPQQPGLGLMRSQSWHKKPTDKPKVPQNDEVLNGAAVVLDIDNGEILTAVSVPWRQLDAMSDDPLDAERWQRINRPWLNRAIAFPYPPGSTIKPLVLAALYSDRKLGLDQRIECTGALYADKPGKYRCWLYKSFGKTHGHLSGPNAIMRSCNVFFFNAGLRLGAPELIQWYERFGLGAKSDCGMTEEIATRGATGRHRSEAALMAIGQGPVEWTVLQSAAVYATIARNGVYIRPTFIQSPTPLNDRSHGIDLQLDRRGLTRTMEGLRLSANDRNGTTNSLRRLPGVRRESVFTIKGVGIYAKSGTAQAPDLYLNTTDNEGNAVRLIARQGDHSWTLCLAGRDGAAQPKYVIAVVAEYAGSGAHVAGPIVNQILYALRDEGYL